MILESKFVYGFYNSRYLWVTHKTLVYNKRDLNIRVRDFNLIKYLYLTGRL